MHASETPSVLIADDHRAFGMMVAAVVRASITPNVSVVQTIEAAMAELTMRRHDFLITDLRFGTHFGGLELIRQVRSHKRFELQTLPILVLSANADMPTVKRARAMGVNDFLGKPVSPALLVQRIHAMAQASARNIVLPGADQTPASLEL